MRGTILLLSRDTLSNKYDGPEVIYGLYTASTPEAEFKETHGVWDPMPEFSITLPLQSRLQHIYHWQRYAKVDLNPMPAESTLSPRDFGFGLRSGLQEDPLC